MFFVKSKRFSCLSKLLLVSLPVNKTPRKRTSVLGFTICL